MRTAEIKDQDTIKKLKENLKNTKITFISLLIILFTLLIIINFCFIPIVQMEKVTIYQMDDPYTLVLDDCDHKHLLSIDTQLLPTNADEESTFYIGGLQHGN